MKEQAAAEHATATIGDYADAKEPWFHKAFTEMEQWAADTDWHP